jgi:hypothetical protein
VNSTRLKYHINRFHSNVNNDEPDNDPDEPEVKNETVSDPHTSAGYYNNFSSY